MCIETSFETDVVKWFTIAASHACIFSRAACPFDRDEFSSKNQPIVK